MGSNILHEYQSDFGSFWKDHLKFILGFMDQIEKERERVKRDIREERGKRKREPFSLFFFSSFFL